MPEGKIKWFDRRSGAGFIRTKKGENVFFCSGVVEHGDRDNIRDGQHVTFDFLKKWKGISPAASKVKISDLSR